MLRDARARPVAAVLGAENLVTQPVGTTALNRAVRAPRRRPAEAPVVGGLGVHPINYLWAWGP